MAEVERFTIYEFPDSNGKRRYEAYAGSPAPDDNEGIEVQRVGEWTEEDVAVIDTLLYREWHSFETTSPEIRRHLEHVERLVQKVRALTHPAPDPAGENERAIVDCQRCGETLVRIGAIGVTTYWRCGCSLYGTTNYGSERFVPAPPPIPKER